MKREDIIDFLNFRKKFSKLDWFELNRFVDNREKEKAAKIELDDFDVDLIMNRIESCNFIRVED